MRASGEGAGVGCSSPPCAARTSALGREPTTGVIANAPSTWVPAVGIIVVDGRIVPALETIVYEPVGCVALIIGFDPSYERHAASLLGFDQPSENLFPCCSPSHASIGQVDILIVVPMRPLGQLEAYHNAIFVNGDDGETIIAGLTDLFFHRLDMLWCA